MGFIQQRIITYIGVFLLVVNLDFILPRLLPGNAALVFAGEGSSFGPEIVKELTKEFGLNRPESLQYALYLKNLFLTWPPNFGVSFEYYPEHVSYLFAVRFGWTLLLIGSSFILALLISVGLASYNALRRAGKSDLASLYGLLTAHSLPLFWTAMVLLWVFGIQLHWFPYLGNTSLFATTPWQYFIAVIRHATLPIVAMTISVTPEFYLLLRGSVQEILRSDYVIAAKTRGLTDRMLAFSYILRNAFLPFVSVTSYSMASLISRVVLVETVFGYPGIGDLIVDAVGNRDYPVLQGALFYVMLIVIAGGIVGDLITLRLDPKIRIVGSQL
jgi:peptide/nickel transport system permease protein